MYGPPYKSPFLYRETAPMDPETMSESDIVWPAGPRGTAPTAAHPPNCYGAAPHTPPAPENRGSASAGAMRGPTGRVWRGQISVASPPRRVPRRARPALVAQERQAVCTPRRTNADTTRCEIAHGGCPGHATSAPTPRAAAASEEEVLPAAPARRADPPPRRPLRGTLGRPAVVPLCHQSARRGRFFRPPGGSERRTRCSARKCIRRARV